MFNKLFLEKKLNKSLRFIFIPETIGSINYIHKNYNRLKKNVIGGFNLSCIGDERQHSCMLTKKENNPSDFAILEVYKKLKLKFKKYSFLQKEVQTKGNIILLVSIYLFLQYFEQNMVILKNIIHHLMILI